MISLLTRIKSIWDGGRPSLVSDFGFFLFVLFLVIFLLGGYILLLVSYPGYFFGFIFVGYSLSFLVGLDRRVSLWKAKRAKTPYKQYESENFTEGVVNSIVGFLIPLAGWIAFIQSESPDVREHALVFVQIIVLFIIGLALFGFGRALFGYSAPPKPHVPQTWPDCRTESDAHKSQASPKQMMAERMLVIGASVVLGSLYYLVR